MTRREKIKQRLKERIGFFRIFRVRKVLNRLTRGRVGHYSTAEHYSTGPSAKVLDYYQYDPRGRLDCPVCDWSGPAESGDRNLFADLFDVCCPRCDKMLLVVGWPTLEQIEQAARRGNVEAKRELARLSEPPGDPHRDLG